MTIEMRPEDQLGFMSAVDAFVWLDSNKVMLGGGPYTLAGREYQLGLFEEDHPRQCCIKGAQMGITEVWVLKTLHGMIHSKYPRGALYLFPTRDDVKDFSKARFDPLIESNPCIGAYVKATDSQNIKRIGQGFLYLRGARATKTISDQKRSSSQLKSIPVDRVVFDERDEMSDDMVTLAEERVSSSQVKELMYLGTPTIPEIGIDEQFQLSDQRVWMLKCPKCGTDTCLELEFPDCIQWSNDRYIRACRKCGGELHPGSGRWVAQYPSRSKDLVGWWISQLNSIFIDPGKILSLYNDPPHGDLSEVMNSKLGRAYIPAENKLTPQLVWGTCGQDLMATKHEGPTCMGVDVGRVLHVVIAERSTRSLLKVVKVCRIDSFNDLHDLAQQYNVKCAVIDYKPEIRKVREFQAHERFQVFACDYIEKKTGQAAWDEKDDFVKVNRTEICDATHELVVNPGRLEIPRRCEEVAQFVKEMCNMAKTLITNEVTGSKEYRYRGLGASKPDHYRHALNYCLLASQRIGVVSDKNLIAGWFAKRRGRSYLSA